ncbi:MAG: GNAT family N-acetyltransferase [Pseudonocardiales bacterium]|nr:GNAT family N-acetyltransferase [Pseudonocardiales bacterium]
MSKPYGMDRADIGDLSEVMALLDERTRWLRERGHDQWNTGRDPKAYIINAIGRRNTWLLRDNGTSLATLTLTSQGDPDFWTLEELRQPALYLGKMASTVRRSGEGLGSLMLAWAQDLAARTGFDYLRWDVWRTNKQLQDYYRSLGGRYIRTVPAAHRWSGALFHIPARRIAGLSDHVITCSGISAHEPSRSFISSLER